MFHNNQNVLKLLQLLLLSFLVSPLIPTHCRRRGLLLHLITLSDTHTHTHSLSLSLSLSLSVGLLWIGDQPEAETSTWKHTTFTKDEYPYPRRDLNPQSQHYYLDRAASGSSEFTTLLHCCIALLHCCIVALLPVWWYVLCVYIEG